MMHRILPLITLANLLMTSLVASAQTTQPAGRQQDAAWVQQFFQSLSGDLADGSPDAVGVTLARFEKNQSATYLDLYNATSGRSATVSLAYVGTPKTMASDIARSLREQSAPDSIRQMFTPRSDKDIEHADQVASRWLQSVLKPADGDAVGVLVLCTDTDSADHPADRIAAPSPPLIVLIDAETKAGESPRIRRIVFGDPRGQ